MARFLVNCSPGDVLLRLPAVPGFGLTLLLLPLPPPLLLLLPLHLLLTLLLVLALLEALLVLAPARAVLGRGVDSSSSSSSETSMASSLLTGAFFRVKAFMRSSIRFCCSFAASSLAAVLIVEAL